MKPASPFSFARWGALLTLLTILVIPAQQASAQYCMEYDPPDPFDTTDDCRAMPANDRTFRPVVMEWKNSDFLLHSRGNELEFMSLSNPENPVRMSRSHFNVGYIGDEDYALKTWGVCDDCTYGYGIYSLATVFFELGTGPSPVFTDYQNAEGYANLTGGMTFKHDDVQYVIHEDIGGIGGGGACGISSGLFVFNGTNPDALPFVQCVTKPGGVIFRVYGGLYVQDDRYDNGDAFLWLSDATEIFIYKIVKPGGPDSLELQYVRTLGYGRYDGTTIAGYAVDYDRDFAVSTTRHGVNVWSLSNLDGGPIATLPDNDTKWLTVGDGIVVMGPYGTALSPLYSYDFSVPSNPTELEPDYWNLDQPWNESVGEFLPCWGGSLGGTFTSNGDFLFLSRYETMQRHDYRNCGGPQAPTAHATMGRWNGSICTTLVGGVYPGDDICAKSESSGDISTTEIWITDAGGTTVDSTSGGATVPPLPYAIPIGGANGQPSSKYTAHVRVANDVGETEDIDFTLVDLTPEASISFTPVAPLTGEDLLLTGEGEGTPAVPDGDDSILDPFEWTVTDPSGEPQTLWGANPSAVALSEAGLYQIDLKVYYRHGAAAPYVATKSLDLEISSVSAAFVVTPTSPVNTADVVLNGGQSRWSDGVTPVWKWEYRQAGDFWQDLTPTCGATQTCTINGSDTTQFFTPGTYDFQLTLTNDPDESKTQAIGVNIADGTVNLDFSWSPNNPEIGQSVGFSVLGVGGVDSVEWRFGGSNCDGTSQIVTCTPNIYVDCMIGQYEYASSGNKQVTLNAVIDGVQFSAGPKTVTVANTGTCSGGGGGGGGGGGTPSCSYVVYPPTRTVPATGGTGYAISVTTQVGCTWNVSESASWISVTSNSSGSGNATVTYNVSPNSGTTRSAVMTIGGKTHTVTQSEPIPVDFTFTPTKPDIGEEAIFSVTDNRVTPIRWEFDGANCDGSSAVLDCSAAPAACLSIPWEYAQAGWKSVRLVAQEGEKTRGIQVLDQGGECCFKDGPPTAAFTVTPNPVFTREDVVFTDASFKSDEFESPKTTALGFTWDPIDPVIGERVNFTITGIGAVDSAEWDMGSSGCGNYEQVGTCTPLPGLIDCLGWTYEFASAGPKTVELTINGGQSLVSDTITILNEGSCGGGGGGGGGCSYSISPSLKNFGQNGGDGTITVTTTAGCEWTATESASWISITGGSSGSGSGTVSYSVEPNTDVYRTANIVAAGKNHSVRQAAYEGPQDTEATAWNWTVSLGETTIVTSDQATFTYSFDEPGLYDVRYEVSNCEGSDVEFDQLLVEVAPVIIPEAFLVPSAVRAPGQNDTTWRTELKIFNPDTSVMRVEVEYWPGDTDDSQAVGQAIAFNLAAGGTRAYPDILHEIVDPTGDFNGSLNISYTNSGEEEISPLIVSRTYNDTPGGTFGQFVPAVPVLPAEDNRLFLTGLVHNLYSRTNIRLANMGDESVVAAITVVDKYGDVLGEPVYRTVQPASTTQVNAIAEVAGITGTTDIFSVQVDTGSPEVSAWASVVDNQKGDPVLYSSMIIGEDDTKLWVPGLASLPGANDSEWRSDVTFFNPVGEAISFDVRYIRSEGGDERILKPRGVEPGNALYYYDVIGSTMLPSGEDSKGYLVVESFGGSALPQIAARTYNLDVSGGTYGQNVFVFRSNDLIVEGFKGFIAGIAISETNDTGFRTNLGLLNTDDFGWAELRLMVLNEEGVAIGDVVDLWLEPGEFKDFNLADRLNLPAVDLDASVVIEVLSGGPVGAYGSTIDNRTHDPILIPAVPDIHQFLR